MICIFLTKLYILFENRGGCKKKDSFGGNILNSEDQVGSIVI